jgi:hypothetical protein
MKANDYDHASELLKALIHVTGIACDHPNRPVSQAMLGLLFEQMQGLVADMDESRDTELKKALDNLIKSAN